VFVHQISWLVTLHLIPFTSFVAAYYSLSECSVECHQGVHTAEHPAASISLVARSSVARANTHRGGANQPDQLTPPPPVKTRPGELTSTGDAEWMSVSPSAPQQSRAIGDASVNPSIERPTLGPAFNPSPARTRRVNTRNVVPLPD
jgi:hypothetical protein